MEPHRYIGNIQFLRCETDIIVENKFSHIAMRGYYNAFGIYVKFRAEEKTMFLCGLEKMSLLKKKI